MQDNCICYKEDTQDLLLFICTSNFSFGNNTLDQKSFQNYIIELFGKAVA